MTNEDRLAALEKNKARDEAWPDNLPRPRFLDTQDALFALCKDYQSEVERLRAVNAELQRKTQTKRLMNLRSQHDRRRNNSHRVHDYVRRRGEDVRTQNRRGAHSLGSGRVRGRYFNGALFMTTPQTDKEILAGLVRLMDAAPEGPYTNGIGHANVYLAQLAGGFTVRGCPKPEALAEFLASIHTAISLAERVMREMDELQSDRDEWKQQHENLLAVRQQDLASYEARTRHYPLAAEIADLIHRMRRGDYSKGTALDLAQRWLNASKRDPEQGV